jgi:hypothetical protein
MCHRASVTVAASHILGRRGVNSRSPRNALRRARSPNLRLWWLGGPRVVGRFTGRRRCRWFGSQPKILLIGGSSMTENVIREEYFRLATAAASSPCKVRASAAR